MDVHFTDMYKEIFQQPDVVEKSCRQASSVFSQFYSLLQEAKFHIHIIGSGTSYHAALAGGIAMANLSNRMVITDDASEWQYKFHLSESKSNLLVAISQSGESSDVIRIVKKARDANLKIVAITNTQDSSLDKLSDLSIITPAGVEKAIAATKSYSTALACLLEWSYEIGLEVNPENTRLPKIKNDLLNIRFLMHNTLTVIEETVQKISPNIALYESIFLLGTGSNYATALEGEMKLKETGNVFAEGFGLREFMHGHIQLVSEKTPIIVTLSGEEDSIVVKRTLKNINDLKPTLYIFNQAESGDLDMNNNEKMKVYQLPEKLDPLISPLTLILPLQLLACYNSVTRGYNPDKPSKLSKITL